MPTYDGNPHQATITVVPMVTVAVTYNGAAAPPTNAGNYAVSVTTMDSNYAGVGSGTLTIKQAQPTITWNNPADISFGTALSGTQLNATSNVPGTFTYSPSAGTVLDAGDGQILTADFVPTDRPITPRFRARTSPSMLRPLHSTWCRAMAHVPSATLILR